eukprot:TRINITY_DN37091_c0_g1_i1.p2 TRINITY_DN37091_c0_g1~~TRINITY_DN37091_c0_g1_i1.p2  ORF type:complete len:218 (-),score=44.65 TRINITY_DN37091_c0_g1_i1:25-654(-)
MGANNTKGLYLCETIYPPENGRSCIPPEKLEKAIRKGDIPPPSNDDEEDLDGDMDAVIDDCIRQVWQYYDPKSVGYISKKQTQQFFKDALNLVALRKMCKVKDLFQGRKEGAALDEAFRKINTSGDGRVTFEQFEEFINMCELDEAVQFVTGAGGEVQIDTNVQMVDNSDLPSGGGPVKGKIEYRDYSALEDQFFTFSFIFLKKFQQNV